MDSRQTVRCSSCGTEKTFTVHDGQTIRVTHQCPYGWERVS